MENGYKCKIGQVAHWLVEEVLRLYIEYAKLLRMEVRNVKETVL
jgi:hypothetical protein